LRTFAALLFAGGLPAVCSYDCGFVYTGFLRDCHAETAKILAPENPDDPDLMAAYEAFNEVCADQDPLSLVRAITKAQCWTCGDETVNGDKGEECDPPDLENTGCTDECKLVVCPALAFDVEGGTVQVSNNGTYPSTATYACEDGAPPSGAATRECMPDGTWSEGETLPPPSSPSPPPRVAVAPPVPTQTDPPRSPRT
jgi:hypothetical protein